MDEKTEAFKKAWYARNPVHETNANTGEDMFWKTARMVAEDYCEANVQDETRGEKLN